MKKIFTLLLMLFSICTALMAEMVAVSADGDETTYALLDVKRIEVSVNSTSASMTVLLNDGTIEGNYQKLLFAEPTTSVDELGEISLFVYPNPVSNTLNIRGVDENALLTVFNLSGQCVMQEKGVEIDVTSLYQGTYILRINNQYIKFIKK